MFSPWRDPPLLLRKLLKPLKKSPWKVKIQQRKTNHPKLTPIQRQKSSMKGLCQKISPWNPLKSRKKKFPKNPFLLIK